MKDNNVLASLIHLISFKNLYLKLSFFCQTEKTESKIINFFAESKILKFFGKSMKYLKRVEIIGKLWKEFKKLNKLFQNLDF